MPKKKRETLVEKHRRQSANKERREIYALTKGMTPIVRRRFLDDRRRERNDLLQQVRERNAKIFERENREREFNEAGKAAGVDFSTFVPADELEYLHIDGTRAVKPSILRHMGDRVINMEILERADRRGPAELDAAARAMAAKFEVDLQEVYTFLLSP